MATISCHVSDVQKRMCRVYTAVCLVFLAPDFYFHLLTDRVIVVRQRNRRSRGENTDDAPPRGDTRLSQDLSSVLSSSDVAAYDINDLMMPSIDTTIACLDNGDAYSWIDNSDLTYNRDGDNRTQISSASSTLASNPTPPSRGEGTKETLAEQLMKLSNRAACATREIECAIISMPLTVNSPVVNEAFEAANALVHIINSIAHEDAATDSSQPSSRDNGEGQPRTNHCLILLALAAHQHILDLFHAVCNSIKSSLGSVVQKNKPQLEPQALHGLGSSAAQFIMVLQLIMHLLNRLGRSLRMRNQGDTEQQALVARPEGDGEGSSLQSIVDSAQVMLRMLPEEHIKLSKFIQELQASIEEGVYI